MILLTMQILQCHTMVPSGPVHLVKKSTSGPMYSLPAVPDYSVLKKLYGNKLIVFQELKKRLIHVNSS